MSDLISEGPRPIAAVGREHPATRTVNVRTLTRWALRGVRGVKLEATRVGNRLMTTPQALDRFLAATNDVPQPSPTAPRSPAERRRASEQAAKQLEAIGA